MRTIDADDFFKTFPELDTEPYNNFQTIDAVPVVRCKNCKHAETLFFGEGTGKKVLLCHAWQAYINPSMYDYCSKGERRKADATD